MTKITVNGREIDADPKKPLIAACHENGIDVPMYCYHPGLRPVGSCRICQVEVKQGDAPARVVASCRTPVAEGMIVNTDSPKAHDVRRECLEFLLKNHPLDCPICDKAGECDLQDYSFAEGQTKGRTHEPRRKLEKRKSLGDVIVLDEERCILCSRCVRFFEDVTKKPQLTVADLGSRSVISTFLDKPLKGNYQGNIADICPVGALTLKRFRFQARVWNLSKHLSTCAECSRGCSVTAEVLRGGDTKRFRPRFNPKVNQWWMCDTGRFAFAHVNAADRAVALRRTADGLEACDLDAALSAAASALRGKSNVAVVLSPFATNEEAAAAKALAARLGAKTCFVSPAPNALKDDFLHTGDPCPNRRGLTDLGFAGLAAAEVAGAIAGAGAVVLAGERVVELLGAERVAALTGTRVVLFDTHCVDAAALDACIGVPVHVEKDGHWTNVEGHLGRLTIARGAPRGVRALDENLKRLSELVSPAGAKA
ncbi:MAG: (2Fe-2S)-binding protein [Planctomycetes bacterium]|nr:(2Fe-2S)-binding protein [Planctomycetota bacterium]